MLLDEKTLKKEGVLLLDGKKLDVIFSSDHEDQRRSEHKINESSDDSDANYKLAPEDN